MDQFPGSRQGQYPLAHIALVMYGANLVAATLMLGLHWRYATSKDRLVRAPLPPAVIRLRDIPVLAGFRLGF